MNHKNKNNHGILFEFAAVLEVHTDNALSLTVLVVNTGVMLYHTVLVVNTGIVRHMAGGKPPGD